MRPHRHPSRRLPAALLTAGLAAGLVTTLAPLAAPSPAGAQERRKPPACSEVAGFGELDFWVGEWDVYEKGELAGHNRIEKILDGCAVLEHWSSEGGGDGKSLFYYLPEEDTWKQVWVTGFAAMPGGIKEKALVERLPGGGLRFQGRVPRPGGRSVLDRTTLTPLPEGRVRQVIEISGDEGETWESGWDAVYVPAGSPAPTAPAAPAAEDDSSEPGDTQPGTSSQVEESEG